jgi:hypothetical protein
MSQTLVRSFGNTQGGGIGNEVGEARSHQIIHNKKGLAKFGYK